MLFAFLGHWVPRRGEGASKGTGTQPVYASFRPRHLKKQRFRLLCPPKMTMQGMYSMFYTVFRCFSPYFGMGCTGPPKGGVSPRGLVHHLFIQVYPRKLKNRSFQSCCSHIVTNQNDHPRYVKCVLSKTYVLLTLLSHWVPGRGGKGSPKELVHNPLMHLFTLDSPKMEVSETYSFDIPTTRNDHPTYCKHVLSSIYVLFTLSSFLGAGGGGGVARNWYTARLCMIST